MTTHIDQPTTDHRPANTPGTTTPGTTNQTSSPKRPLPRWVAPVGVAAALCVTGIGVLVNDANNQPEPAPTDPATETGTSQRLVQQSIDDALLEARETTAGGLPAHLEEFEAGVKVDDSYVIAEQNRFNTLRYLRVDDSFAIAEQHRFETLRDLNVDDSVVTATTPQIDVGVSTRPESEEKHNGFSTRSGRTLERRGSGVVRDARTGHSPALRAGPR